MFLFLIDSFHAQGNLRWASFPLKSLSVCKAVCGPLTCGEAVPAPSPSGSLRHLCAGVPHQRSCSEPPASSLCPPPQGQWVGASVVHLCSCRTQCFLLGVQSLGSDAVSFICFFCLSALHLGGFTGLTLLYLNYFVSITTIFLYSAYNSVSMGFPKDGNSHECSARLSFSGLIGDRKGLPTPALLCVHHRPVSLGTPSTPRARSVSHGCRLT